MSDANNTAVRVVERSATANDFLKIVQLFLTQNELRGYVGSLSRHLLAVLAVPVFFTVVAQRRRPFIMLIVNNDRIIGGYTVSKYGAIENAAVHNDPALRRTALRHLVRRTRLLLASASDPVYFWTSNASVRGLGVRLGFRCALDHRYVVTKKAGPLTLSWISTRRPRYGKGLLSWEPLSKLVFAPQDRAMEFDHHSSAERQARTASTA